MGTRESDLLSADSDKNAFKLEYIFYNFKDKPCAYGWFIIPHQRMPIISQVGVWNELVHENLNKIPWIARNVLTELITELKEKESLAELKNLHLEGYDASELLACCVEGVRRVGLRFEQGEYFISALIMAGEIMRQSAEYLKPFLQDCKTGNIIGHVLLGTIEGDIHDLGKNIFKDLLQCNGFEVTDLGVDVPARSFVRQSA